MECEICGRREAVCLVYIEGAKMNSCGQCAKGGKVHYLFGISSSTGLFSAESPVPRAKTRQEQEFVEGYGRRIKDAREKLGLTREALGLKIAEKANYLEMVEKEKNFPSLELTHKLEKMLHIILVQTETEQIQAENKPQPGKSELTLFDVAKIERRKK